MYFVRVIASVAVLCMATSADAAESSAAVRTSAMPLTLQQLQSVRATGRSVLDARRGAVEDSDVSILRQSLHDLREAVDEALSARTGSIVLKRDLRGARQETQVSTASDTSIRERWSAVRAKRLELQSRAMQRDSSRARLERLSATAEKLEQDTERALASSGRERVERLARLRDRLAPRALDERINNDLLTVDSASEPETPTLITITKHR